jgi:glycine cleavage system regulatory protein
MRDGEIGSCYDHVVTGSSYVMMAAAQIRATSVMPCRHSKVTLEMIGHDKPGIVHEISRILVSQGIGINQFESRVMSGPMSAEPLFKAHAKLCVPATIDLEQMQTTLESIAVSLMVDISLKEG